MALYRWDDRRSGTVDPIQKRRGRRAPRRVCTWPIGRRDGIRTSSRQGL